MNTSRLDDDDIVNNDGQTHEQHDNYENDYYQNHFLPE